jgi:hypothetical protein
MKQQITPLEVCFRLIGTHSVIAEIIGYGPTAPYLWEREARNRRAGDLPSTPIMRALLAHSAARQLGLTAEHLIWGATEAEIEAILAERGVASPKGHPSPAAAGEGDAALPPAFTSIRQPNGVAA